MVKFALAAVAITVLSVYGYAKAAEHTVNDRVFSAAQIIRGQQAFRQNCATGCHLVTLTGSDRAPALAGDAFMQRWEGQSVADIYQYIQSTMPKAAPRSLTPQMYIDVVAYILSANGLPAGNADLGVDLDSLGSIRFVPPSGSE